MRRFKTSTFRNQRAGFSFPEMIIYVSVLAIMMVAVVSTIIGIARSYNQVRLLSALDRNAEASFDRMIHEIRLAKDINTSGSVFGTSTGSLSLSTTDSSGEDTTVLFNVSAGALRISEGGAASGPLTSGVTVTNLVFRSLSATTSKAVKIELQLEARRGTTVRIKSYYSTAILRGSY